MEELGFSVKNCPGDDGGSRCWGSLLPHTHCPFFPPASNSLSLPGFVSEAKVKMEM